MNDYCASTTAWARHSDSYFPVNQPHSWYQSQAQSPSAMVSHYNDLLQRAADFYATLGNTFDSMSSPSSDSAYGSSPERCISSSTVASIKNSIPAKIERRREQNRFSQRAYRERKEKHQKQLEEQIAQWEHKHQLLTRSYSQQTQEISHLKAQIQQLNTEISSLQNGLPGLYSSLAQSPQEFDLVPFFDANPSPSTQDTFSPALSGH